MSMLPNFEEIPLSEARTHLAEITNEVAYRHKRFVLTRKGKKLVALIPIEDLEALQAIEDRIDLEDARKALIDAEKHGTIPWDTIRRKFDL